jgi:DNA polymerase, archaea type
VETLDLFLLGGSYKAQGDGVVVELYGKSRSGESVVARYYGFRPYFEISEPTAQERERLTHEPDVLETIETTRWIRGEDRPALQVVVKFPWTVPNFRERYQKPGVEGSVLACDIPFVHRFLYDKHVGLTLRCEVEDEPAEVRAQYTTQRVVRVVTEGGRDLVNADPFRPPLTYLSFDIENAIRERTIFTICGVVRRESREEGFRFEGDEKEILTRFLEKVCETDPDVITGYNIGGYDFPLLLERFQALHIGGGLVLGRDRSIAEEAGERLWRIRGRIVADAWWSARRDLRPKQESLDYVARILLNDKKLDVDRRNISAEWEKDRAAVMEYCEQDARLALRILLKLRSIEKAIDLATVSRLPLEEGLNGRTSLFVDSLLIPKADERKVGVPMTHRLRRESPIEGGYVHAIRPGLYEWVVVLDFKAMYPSIIISRNLCFTTLTARTENVTVAPDGAARFLPASERRGIIPEILVELLQRRDEFRRLGRESGSPDLERYYDGLQAAVKILMNSFYGVLASSFYRFTNKEIGAAITAFAREQIKGIIRELEGMGHEIVYSDTDSVFVRSPVASLEGAKAFGEEIAKRFTKEGVTFEFQSVYRAFFSHGVKKRYVGHSLWPKDEIVVRGYESRRTDAFDFQVDALNQVFDLVLQGNPQKALERSRELVKEVLSGSVPTERLVVARSVREEGQYNEATRDALPFLRAFRQLQQEGYDVIPGMKVAWIVTNANAKPQAIEPWIGGRTPKQTPDYRYYAERVAQTLARVTEVYEWDASELIEGKRRPKQQKLFDAPSEETTAPEPTAEPLTLDSPIVGISEGPAPKRRVTRRLATFDEPEA